MYRFYIDGVLLPVTPGKITTKIKNKNKTILMLNEGEVNLLKAPGLTEIKFEALLPQQIYPFAIYENGFRDAKYFLDKFEELKAGKTSFRFIVTRMSPRGMMLHNTNILMAIEDYEIQEDANKFGSDVNVKFKLKQYREYGTKVLNVREDGTATILEKPNKRNVDILYTVGDGEILYTIAKKKLGDGEKYTKLMEINSIDNPNDITPGQVIRLV